ncbi:hypothetical protein ACJJTC_009535 [Scirpophaga incertulas]
MSWLTILCLGIVVSCGGVKAVSKEEIHMIEEVMHMHFHECNKQYGVSDDDLKAVKEQKNINLLDPCLIGCVFKKANLISDNGIFTEKKLIEDVKKYLMNEEDQTKAIEVINKCLSVNDAEVSDGDQGCERAKLLMICFVKNKNHLIPPSPSA